MVNVAERVITFAAFITPILTVDDGRLREVRHLPGN
jgi:hypothetical protein